MKEELAPRERVRIALNHEEPDRVPIDITYTWKPYVKLREMLGLPSENVFPDMWGKIYESPDLVQALGTDFLHLGLKGPSWAQSFSWDLDEYVEEYSITWRKISGPEGEHFEMMDYPIKEPTMNAIEAFDWPDPNDPARYKGVREEIKHAYETTDLAIIMRLGTNIWDHASYMCGQENWWLYLSIYPDFCVALMNRLADIQREIYLQGLDLVGEYISIIRLGGEDFGTQQSLILSTKMFREIVKPILASVYLPVKEKYLNINLDGKLMLHSDGAIRPLIPDFIDIGVDILDPVQPRPIGMNGFELKRDFGDRISFHGGIDTQGVLPFGTLEEVESETRRKIEMFAPGGGYILNPAHNVQADVAPEKLVRMVETVKEYGRYPIRRHFADEELMTDSAEAV